MVSISWFDYTTLLGYAAAFADDDDMRHSIKMIVERVKKANPGTVRRISFDPDVCAERIANGLQSEIRHKDSCPRAVVARVMPITLPPCTCYPRIQAQDLDELDERKKFGWHLASCVGFGQVPAVGGLCSCDAHSWLARRAAAQGEARERVKPRDDAG